MRIEWSRTVIGTIAGGWITGFVSFATAAGPTVPGELRIDAYSSHTVEIFWSRAYDDTGVAGYEIIRNGRAFWLGDVTSYLDSDVESSASVSYNIVAVDTDDNRSPISATLTYSNQNASSSSCSGTSSCSSSSSVSISAPPAGVDSNQAQQSAGAPGHMIPGPSGIRGSVYSDSALELFWDAADATYGISAYDIYRNGELVGRSEGTSYFDSNLSAGTHYRYKVYSIDLHDQRSEVFAEVDFQTTGGGNGSSGSTSFSHADSTGENLTGSVWGETYSTRAAEIFWDYSGSAAVNVFEVVRNGAIVTQTSGRSYYDESLSAETDYRYEIRAITGAQSKVLGAIELKTPSLW